MFDDPLAEFGLSSTLPMRRGVPRLPALPPQAEESLLNRMAGGLLGGVGYVGESLGKLGRAVRGGLGGKPRELLNVIPFSDALGITNEEDRVSGKDLLSNVGLLDRGDDSWLGFGAGLATEMALDPASYLTGLGGAALTKAGAAAKSAGVLPKTVAGRATTTLNQLMTAPGFGQLGQVAQQNANISNALMKKGLSLADVGNDALGGVAKFSTPFGSAVLGTGQTGANIMDAVNTAGRYAGKGARLVPGVPQLEKYALEPAARNLRAMFKPNVMGSVLNEGQEIAPAIHAEKVARENALREKYIGIRRQMQDQGIGGEEIRQLGEGTLVGPARPASMGILKALRDPADNLLREGGALGLSTDKMQNWVPRQSVDAFYETNRNLIQPRDPIFNALPDMSQGVNRLSLDPKVSGPNRIVNQARVANPDAAATNIIRLKHLQMSPADIKGTESFLRPTGPGSRADFVNQLDAAQTAGNAPLVTQLEAQIAAADAMAKKYGSAPALARWAGSLSPEHVTRGVPYFANDVVQDFLSHGSARLNAIARAKFELDYMAKMATPATQAAVPGARTLADVLEKKGLGESLTLPTGETTRTGVPYLTQALAGRLGLNPQKVPLHQLTLPPEFISDILGHSERFGAPQSVNNALEMFDRLQSANKIGQTIIKPAHHVRNLLSGAWMNLDEGLAGGGREANALLRGEVLPGIAAKLPNLGATDADVTRKIADLAWAHRAGGWNNSTDDILRGTLQPGESLLAEVPGTNPLTVAGALGELKGLAPSGQPGLRGFLPKELPLKTGPLRVNEDFAPIMAGRQMSRKVEGSNRLGAFISGLKQGMTPERAAEATSAAHYAYGNYTPFERDVMRRVFPFYGWMRSNLPHQLERLAESPGGLTGSAVRATGNLQANRDTFVPAHLGGGMALPVGGEQDGTQRFLTSVGLPFEDLGMLKAGPDWMSRTALGLLGQTSGILKAPAEWATGKQFYSGRDMGDLYSRTGVPVADQILMNSPLSGAASFLGTVTDPRKWQDPLALLTNITSGVRLSDVDVDKQREIAVRDAIDSALRGTQGVRHFDTMYVKPDDLAKLGPEEILLLSLNKALERRAKERAKPQTSSGMIPTP